MDIRVHEVKLGDVIKVHDRAFVLTEFKEAHTKGAEVTFEHIINTLDIEKAKALTDWFTTHIAQPMGEENVELDQEELMSPIEKVQFALKEHGWENEQIAEVVRGILNQDVIFQNKDGD